MKPKKKAKKLLEKYMFCHVSPMYLISAKEHSKQCALIAADELIESCAFFDHKRKKEFIEDIDDRYFSTYWMEVKSEIEKL